MNPPRGVWLDDLTWQEAACRFDGDAVVVIPVVSGGVPPAHLPLKTASLIARALGQKLLERLAVVVAPVVVAPVVVAPVVVAPVVDADSHSRREAPGQIVVERLNRLQSLGVRRLAILDVALYAAAPPDVSGDFSGDVLMLRVCDRSDAGEYATSCLMALDPRSVRMPLLPAGSCSDAFAGERGMAADVDAAADALVAKWPDLI